MINAVNLHLVKNLGGVLQRFGDVGKDLVHFRLGLEPLLLAVKHQILIVEFTTG